MTIYIVLNIFIFFGIIKSSMKEKIHPEYYRIVATCICGNEIELGSTKPEIRVEICSNCHPFYTGTQKILDAEGRVDRFQKRYNKK